MILFKFMSDAFIYLVTYDLMLTIPYIVDNYGVIISYWAVKAGPSQKQYLINYNY